VLIYVLKYLQTVENCNANILLGTMNSISQNSKINYNNNELKVISKFKFISVYVNAHITDESSLYAIAPGTI
jgi:hypothetical protein